MMKFKKFLAAAMTGVMMFGMVATAAPAICVYAEGEEANSTRADLKVIIDYPSLTANDYICEMDADFSHNPADLVRLRQTAVDGADVVVGSRYVTGVNVVNWPMGRVLMSFYASKYVRLITRMPVHDTTAGFVCYRRRVLEALPLDKIKFKGYAFQIEMKFTAYKYGFKVVEEPIIFVNRVLGTSKMNSGIFGEAVFGVIRLKWNSFFKKYPDYSSTNGK